MHRRTWERAGAVACVTASIIVASQVLASVEPDYVQRRGDDDPPVASVAPSTSAPSSVPAPAPAAPEEPATTTTAALPPITGPVRLDERSALDGRGIGPVEAGMTVAEAEQAAGRRFQVVDREDDADRCFGARPDGLAGLRFAVQGPAADPRQARIVRVEAVDATWATVSGVRVGQSVAEVRRAYGGRITGPGGDGLLTVSVRDAGRSFAVAFVTSARGVVTELRSGDAAAVGQPEGCS